MRLLNEKYKNHHTDVAAPKLYLLKKTAQYTVWIDVFWQVMKEHSIGDNWIM